MSRHPKSELRSWARFECQKIAERKLAACYLNLIKDLSCVCSFLDFLP